MAYIVESTGDGPENESHLTVFVRYKQPGVPDVLRMTFKNASNDTLPNPGMTLQDVKDIHERLGQWLREHAKESRRL
jgi:hypothetical protein